MLGDMAMVFAPNDEDGFLAARQSLMERFEHWLGGQQDVGLYPTATRLTASRRRSQYRHTWLRGRPPD